jgi:dynein intermediate chain 1
MHSAEMWRALRVVERQAAQNAADEVYADFRFWEDASDAFRDNLGTCLPLWRFEDDARTKKKVTLCTATMDLRNFMAAFTIMQMVTDLAWNTGYPDLFAAGYGSYDFLKQGSGLIAVYSLKNVGRPEYIFSLDVRAALISKGYPS